MRHTLSKQFYNSSLEEYENKEISAEKYGKECEIRVTSEKGTQQIILDKKELSDFIGLMLHVQSKIKREN